MSNDDHTLGAVLLLVAGGTAGYAAGRWLVDPLLAGRAGRRADTARPAAPAIPPTLRTPRALAAGGAPLGPIYPYAGPSGEMRPIDPYAGPSGEMKPTDPYGGPSGAMRPIDPYTDIPARSVVAVPPVITPSVSTPTPAPLLAPIDGPIMSPLQVDPSLAAAAPITSPAQVTRHAPQAFVNAPAPSPTRLPSPSSSGRFATSAGVRRFDPVFERYRGRLPLEYLRALVERESDGRPEARTSSAIGLMQIVPVVLTDYNKRHGTAYQGAQLVDPATNVAIGCELLRLIIGSYRKNHPRIPNLQPDWSNPRFVELLTLGWNAGFSEAGGLGRVARYLEQLGAIDITIDQVSAHAKLAGASKYLSNPAKVAWCKSVVTLYQRERGLVGAKSTFASS